MGYIDFIKEYKRKLSTDKDIKENKLDFFSDFRDRIDFYVCMDSRCPRTITLGWRMNAMFELDNDDLKYLYNKYYPKIKEELEIEIDKVNKKYDVD